MSNMNRRAFLYTSTLALAFSLSPNRSEAETIKRFSVEGPENMALRGYDSVSYFKQAKAENGDAAHVVVWKGVNWRFAKEADAKQFEAAPENYAPQFGGYCTRAMSLGSVVPADPEVWRIHNGKLYVFYAAPGGGFFDKAPDEMIAKAQAYWQTLKFSE